MFLLHFIKPDGGEYVVFTYDGRAEWGTHAIPGYNLATVATLNVLPCIAHPAPFPIDTPLHNERLQDFSVPIHCGPPARDVKRDHPPTRGER